MCASPSGRQCVAKTDSGFLPAAAPTAWSLCSSCSVKQRCSLTPYTLPTKLFAQQKELLQEEDGSQSSAARSDAALLHAQRGAET